MNEKKSNKGFPLYFQILLGQWEGVDLEIPYGLFRVFSNLLSKKTPPDFLNCKNLMLTL